MIFNGTPDERLIILKALEHEADAAQNFRALLAEQEASQVAQRDAKHEADIVMRLFDVIAKEGGYK